MSDSRLRQIQALQFTDKPAAEALLLAFVRETFPDLMAFHVELRPLAVSLNSFNGFLTLSDGRRLFFKSHVEPGSVVSEYYNSDLLAEAGYPILKPIRASTDYGRQVLIYDVIESPSVFDVARALERGERDDLHALAAAQHAADDTLLQIYLNTLQWQVDSDAANAPIHQLFHHRLAGSRYQEFYAGKPFTLPNGETLLWEDILERRWVINGTAFERTLGEALGDARRLLTPAKHGWSVVGHGDAHNGNVFFTAEGLLYFDPAFGGPHSPLLDLAKPLFHNTAATWMYHPAEVGAALTITLHDDGQTLTIEHDYRPSLIRGMFKQSKIERVYLPLVDHLTQIDKTPRAYYDDLLSAALLCCPLLTMNLADRAKFSPEVALLGLSYVVQVGMRAE